MNIDIALVNDVLVKNIQDLQCAFAYLNHVSEVGEEVSLGETKSMEALIALMAPELMGDEQLDQQTFANKLKAFECACQMLVANLKNLDNDYPEEITVVSDDTDEYDGEYDEEEECTQIDPMRFANCVLKSYKEQLKILNTLSATLSPKVADKYKM